MGEYGPHSQLVAHLIARASVLSISEAEDLYLAHGTRLLINGDEVHAQALAHARRAASGAHLEAEFVRARRDAAAAWRRTRPRQPGPWLLVSQAIADAAGGLVLTDVLDPTSFHALVDPWRQAIGSLVAVGPGRTPVPVRLD
jgi:hypothetical protein